METVEPTRETRESDAEHGRTRAGALAAPTWLQDLGRTSWLVVGFALLMVGLAWILGTAATIVDPLLGATIVATVAMPLVGGLKRHRVPRVAGAALVLVGLIAIATLIGIGVIAGITGQHADI